VLDTKIRDWVLIPIALVIFMVSILRHNIVSIFIGADRPAERKKIQERQILMRSARLRANANRIPQEAFDKRKKYFIDRQEGVFCDTNVEAPAQNANPLMNLPLMDPMNLVDVMKRNVSMLPQLLVMAWVSHLFFWLCVN